MKNVYGDKAYISVEADLKKRLKALILQYDDKEALTIFNGFLKIADGIQQTCAIPSIY